MPQTRNPFGPRVLSKDKDGGQLLAVLANDGSGDVINLIADAITNALEVTGHVIVDTVAAIALGTAIVNGQQTATGTAAALPSNMLTQGVTVQAKSTNTVSVYVGGSGVTATTGLELPAGSAETFPVNNTNLVFIVSASGSPVVTYAGV